MAIRFAPCQPTLTTPIEFSGGPLIWPESETTHESNLYQSDGVFDIHISIVDPVPTLVRGQVVMDMVLVYRDGEPLLDTFGQMLSYRIVSVGAFAEAIPPPGEVDLVVQLSSFISGIRFVDGLGAITGATLFLPCVFWKIVWRFSHPGLQRFTSNQGVSATTTMIRQSLNICNGLS